MIDLRNIHDNKTGKRLSVQDAGRFADLVVEKMIAGIEKKHGKTMTAESAEKLRNLIYLESLYASN